MMTLTIVDLTLHAATICHQCRSSGRPNDESSQEQGDVFVHRPGSGYENCRADQIWVLIRKMENAK